MPKRLRFIKKKTRSASKTTIPQDLKGVTSCKWYQNIEDIPLSRFEDAFLNDNLSALIISGFPGETELRNAWERILIQYADTIGSDEFNLYIHLYREVEIIRVDLESIQFLTSFLRNVRDQYFCDELNKILNINFVFPENDREKYLNQIDRCERRGKAFKIRYDLKMIEFENMKKKMDAKNNHEIEKTYFTSMLIMLSRHYQYRITKDITMGEYVEMVRQYKLYYDKVKL